MNPSDLPIEQLRIEYKKIRKTTFLFTHGTNAEFDEEVKATMAEKGMETTPANFVAAANMVFTETLGAEEERLAEREYDGDGPIDDSDRYMGYDTLEERNMDREWDES